MAVKAFHNRPGWWNIALPWVLITNFIKLGPQFGYATGFPFWTRLFYNCSFLSVLTTTNQPVCNEFLVIPYCSVVYYPACWISAEVARLEEIITQPQFVWMIKSLTVNRAPPLTSAPPLRVAIFTLASIPDFSSSLCIIMRGRVLVSRNTVVGRCNKVMLVCCVLVKAHL